MPALGRACCRPAAFACTMVGQKIPRQINQLFSSINMETSGHPVPPQVPALPRRARLHRLGRAQGVLQGLQPRERAHRVSAAAAATAAAGRAALPVRPLCKPAGQACSVCRRPRVVWDARIPASYPGAPLRPLTSVKHPAHPPAMPRHRYGDQLYFWSWKEKTLQQKVRRRGGRGSAHACRHRIDAPWPFPTTITHPNPH